MGIDSDFAIDVLAAQDVDLLKPLWLQLDAHHRQVGRHLSAAASVREPADSWRVRRDKYAKWMRSPLTRAFIAGGGDPLMGYAMVRVIESAGSWQWGERVGQLETLVVDADVRGAGIGQALVSAARSHLAQHGIQFMNISVLAGNDAAARFYEREGATALLQTVVMPTTRPTNT
jgi:ribosomal protein S18 acetylase RimI-like enzyme